MSKANRERMHENSLTIYDHIYSTLPKARLIVLSALIEMGKGSIEDVALSLGRYPNQVSGRFSELRKAGLIKQEGNKKVNGITVAVWQIV